MQKMPILPFDLGLKGKIGLDGVITLQEAFVFSCVFSFYFLLFEKKKKGKGEFIGKSAEMHFRSNLCLQNLWWKLGNKEGRYRSDLGISDIWIMMKHWKKKKKVLKKLKWRLWLWRRWGFMISFYFLLFGAWVFMDASALQWSHWVFLK